MNTPQILAQKRRKKGKGQMRRLQPKAINAFNTSLWLTKVNGNCRCTGVDTGEITKPGKEPPKLPQVKPSWASVANSYMRRIGFTPYVQKEVTFPVESYWGLGEEPGLPSAEWCRTAVKSQPLLSSQRFFLRLRTLASCGIREKWFTRQVCKGKRKLWYEI